MCEIVSRFAFGIVFNDPPQEHHRNIIIIHTNILIKHYNYNMQTVNTGTKCDLVHLIKSYIYKRATVNLSTHLNQ